MRIRVLEVLATLKRAGAERVAAALARGLDRQRFETTIVSLFDAFPGGFESELEPAGVPVWHLGKRPGLDARMWPRLAHVVREFRPHVVHTHSYVLRYALPAAWGARFVHTVHNVAEKEVEPLGQWIHRLAWRKGAVPVAVSGEVARSFERLYGRKARLIPNGIDIAAFRRAGARAEWRRAHGFREDEVLVVSVARLDPQKNPRGLVEALSAAGAGRLLLAGTGSERAALEGRPGVTLLGVVEDVPALLAAADGFALASHWEGNPLAVMEALAAGLPVVATAVGGVPELIEDGVNGLLVPPGDTQAFGAALARLVQDRELRGRMAQAALASADRFDAGRMVASYAELFDEVARP